MMEPHNLGEGPCILARLFGWNHEKSRDLMSVGSNNNCNNLAREREREGFRFYGKVPGPQMEDTNVAPTGGGGKSYGVQV